MEWFWVTVVYLFFAALGVLGAFVIYAWFAAARDQAEREGAQSRTAAARAAETGRSHSIKVVV